ARQFVRYLRNCTVAKITALAPDQPAPGLAADLLQISPAERARAARSAALFTEEELSRFLSILLRTFDDLGYRQEPRLHLELGVLKLVHLQRLLPVEDLLTQLGATKIISTPSTTPTRKESVILSGALERTKRAEGAKSKDPEGPSPTTAVSSFSTSNHTTDGSLALASAQEPQLEPERPQLVPAKTSDSTSTPDLDTLQSNLVVALASVKGQQSASDALHDANLTLTGDALHIQTTLSKKMLPVVLNADAERLLKSTLRLTHPELKLILLPGEPPTNGAKKPTRPAVSGSVQELAENHPLVQQAKRLFSAEISSVIDLRHKD
ncbi:MAG: DNA polymerase III subunit gamma/tau, partial [Nitrososphaerales archaeon]